MVAAMGLTLIAAVCASGWLRQSWPQPAIAEVPMDAVETWMLESATGIGPITAPRLLEAYRREGLSALPRQAQYDLRGLIADIPAPETPHSSAPAAPEPR